MSGQEAKLRFGENAVTSSQVTSHSWQKKDNSMYKNEAEMKIIP